MVLHTPGKTYQQNGNMGPSLAYPTDGHRLLRGEEYECQILQFCEVTAALLDSACGTTRTRAPTQTTDMVFLRISCSSLSFLSSFAPSLA